MYAIITDTRRQKKSGKELGFKIKALDLVFLFKITISYQPVKISVAKKSKLLINSIGLPGIVAEMILHDPPTPRVYTQYLHDSKDISQHKTLYCPLILFTPNPNMYLHSRPYLSKGGSSTYSRAIAWIAYEKIMCA